MSLLPQVFRRRASDLTQAINNNTQEPKVESFYTPAPYSNPFNRDDIKNVMIFYRKFWSTDTSFKASGHIEFKRGNTTGKQDFKAATIEEILEKMAVFVKSL